MLKHEIHYFLSTFGSRGYTSYQEAEFKKLARAEVIYGYPGQSVEMLVERISREAGRRELSCEIIHNFLDGTAEGIIIEETNSGLINIPLYLLGREHLAAILEDEHIAITKKALLEAKGCFNEAKKIHDKWEKIYVSNMDFGAADSLADETCRRVIGEKKGKGAGSITDRFLGAATADGPADKIESITNGLLKRYFIKGRPGTGKSTLMRKVVRAATAAGFDAEQYHCSFDPKSIDMVVIRELGVCLFDSTAPHEYFPTKAADEIIDIYEAAVTPGTDEKYEKELVQINTEYKLKILEAQKALARARSAYEKTAAYYMAKTDRVELEMLSEHCLTRLLEK